MAKFSTVQNLILELDHLMTQFYFGIVMVKTEMANQSIKFNVSELDQMSEKLKEKIDNIEKSVESNDIQTTDIEVTQMRNILDQARLIPINLSIVASQKNTPTLTVASEFIAHTITCIDENLVEGMNALSKETDSLFPKEEGLNQHQKNQPKVLQKALKPIPTATKLKNGMSNWNGKNIGKKQ